VKVTAAMLLFEVISSYPGRQTGQSEN